MNNIMSAIILIMVASQASAQKDFRQNTNLLQSKDYRSEILSNMPSKNTNSDLRQGLNIKDLAVSKENGLRTDIRTNHSSGGHDGNGGDIACDAKIQTISNDIRLWIENHGPEVGKLNLSTSVYPEQSRPYTLNEYRESMLDLFKLPLDSSCVAKGDSGYPVKVGDNSKFA